MSRKGAKFAKGKWNIGDSFSQILLLTFLALFASWREKSLDLFLQPFDSLREVEFLP